MRGLWLIVALACGGACTDRASVFDMYVRPEPVAVGANTVGQLQSRTCSGSSCDFATIEILEASIDPPGIFDPPVFDSSSPRFSIRALAEGTATFSVTASDGDDTMTFTRELTALAANRVTAAPARGTTPCAAPALYTPDTLAKVTFALHRDDTLLFANDYVPFTVTGASIDPSLSAADYFSLRLPASPATITIGSPLDASLQIALDAIDPATIDAIELSDPDEPLSVLDETTIAVALFSAGRPLCDDSLRRTITSLTPDVCTFGGTTAMYSQQSVHAIDVTGRSAGTCTITVALAGTSLTAMTSFPVTQ